MKQWLFFFTMTMCIFAVACHREDLPGPEDREDLTTPLTIEAIDRGIISILNLQEQTILYSKNGGEKQQVKSDHIDINVDPGDKIAFYGDNENYYLSDIYYLRFYSSPKAYVYGNVMSLVRSSGYEKATALKGSLARLFWCNQQLVNHPERSLMLPATNLSRGCYREMFYGCSGLTRASELPATRLAESCYESMYSGSGVVSSPDLPAMDLAKNCYQGMFLHCSSLVEASALPATTLAPHCYEKMFYDCGALKKAPALPARSLAEWCYSMMFAYCKSLVEAPELPATTMEYQAYSGMFSDCDRLAHAPALPATSLAKACYGGMFQNCISLTEAPALPATELQPNCYWGMFHGCSRLEIAPDLPARVLAEDCYHAMFYGCTALGSVKCLAEDLGYGSPTAEWMVGVRSSGTFVKSATMNTWPSGESGIPKGWNIVDAG